MLEWSLMVTISSQFCAKEFLLADAARRDLTTVRREALLNILWDERFLTRKQLIARIEQVLGPDCFGAKAWQDNFYRDIRLVKQAFQKAGHKIAYSRGKVSGYSLIPQCINPL